MSALNNTKSTLVMLLAALLAAGASSLCCIGPLIYLIFGISAAGLAGIPALPWLQIPMAILSVCLMLYGFWRLYLSPKPLCVNIISRRVLLWSYWFSAPLVLMLITYPYVLPWIWSMME